MRRESSFRTVLHDFYERTYFPAPTWESRWVTVGATVGLLLASLPIAFRLRGKMPRAMRLESWPD